MTYLTFFILGVLHYEKQEWNKSYSFLSQALQEVKDGKLKASQNKDVAYFFRGRVLYNLNKYKEAIDDFEKISSMEYRGKATNNLCVSFYTLANQELNEETWVGLYAEAEKYCQEAIKLKPEWIDPHYSLGAVNLVQKKYDNAAFNFEEAIKLLAKNNKHILYDWAYYGLGLSYEGKGNKEDAIKIFKNLQKNSKNTKLKDKVEEELRKLNIEAGQMGEI